MVNISDNLQHRMHTKFEKGVTFDSNDPTSREGPAVMAHCGMC